MDKQKITKCELDEFYSLISSVTPYTPFDSPEAKRLVELEKKLVSGGILTVEETFRLPPRSKVYARLPQ